MAEPKKETVRIILPSRKEGATIASSPRETAMINLPPKPIPVGASAPSVPTALKPSVPSSAAPGIPKPPSVPSIPKIPAIPSIPKPPSAGVPLAPPVLPKPPAATVPPVAPKPPSTPLVPIKPVVPAPLPVEAKKETARMPASVSGAKIMPQATVQLQKKPEPVTPKSVSTSGPITVAAPVEVQPAAELQPAIGGAALAVALVALAVQLLIMFS